MGEPKLRTLRVLWVALLASPLMLLLAGFVVTAQRAREAPPEPSLLLALGAAALGSAGASIILPRVLLKPALLSLKLDVTDAPSVGPSPRGRRRPRRFEDASVARARLMTAVQTSFILGMALAESVALMGFVLWFLGYSFLHVVWMFAISLVLMVSKFPRREVYEAELEAAYDADLAG